METYFKFRLITEIIALIIGGLIFGGYIIYIIFGCFDEMKKIKRKKENKE